MLFWKVLLLSLRLYASEPDYYDEQPEPELISIEFTYRQKLSIGEVIVDPYEDIAPPLPVIDEPFIF